MPACCARWPDGSLSIVDAEDKTHALIQPDELDDEPAQLWQKKPRFQWHRLVKRTSCGISNARRDVREA